MGAMRDRGVSLGFAFTLLAVVTASAGLLVLLGVAKEDAAADADFLAGKIVQLRIFNDDAGKMNRSLLDVGGAMLAVSQFTLYGDSRKGRCDTD